MESWPRCFHSICPVHNALHILKPEQALGWAAGERDTDPCPRSDRQEWQRDPCPHRRRGIEVGATTSVPGYRQAAATVSVETSSMSSLGQRDLEQAPGQGTEMCLGQEQERHWAKFSGTSLSHHHLLMRRGTWRTTFFGSNSLLWHHK